MAVPVNLKVYKGEELVTSKDYDRDLIKIGRLSSAHLCLEDEKVSRIHAVIDVSQDGSMFLTDMGSVEGTYLNGERITKSQLTFGDTIKVGNTTVKVAQVGQAVAEAAKGDTSQDATTKIVNVAAALGQAATAAPAAAAPAAPTEKNEVRAEKPAEKSAPPAAKPAKKKEAKPEAPAKKRAKPSASKGSGPSGLQVRLSWGDQRVAEHFFHSNEPRTFSVGSEPTCDFAMGGSKFVAVKVEKESYAVRFTNRMKGEYTRGDKTMGLTQAIESSKANQDDDGYAIPINDGDYVWVDLGGIVLEAFVATAPKRVVVPFSESVDFTVLNIFLVLFFLGALFVITSLNRELEGDEFADELSGTEARIAKLIVKPPETQKNPFLEQLAQQKQKQSGEMSAKHRGTEGEAGSKTAPKKNAHMAPQGKPSEKDQARMLTNKIFGGKGGGLSTVFGPSGLGGELTAAMGGLFGASAGDSKGFGGLGLRGTGAGGGGVGDTIGIGAIGTKGRGGGTGSYGTGVGVLGGKKVSDIGITSSDPEVMGSLDKELIRQVIRAHRDQIRYCYETQLARFPKLAGKVAVKFVISAVGSVASANVVQSTVGNGELDTCVAGRVRTWIFPKPKGGGVVVVTYPFLFKQSGE